MAEIKDTVSNHELFARLDWAEKTLHAMLYGGKPFIDARDPAQSWLIDQMTRMYKAGFLCEEAQSYITLPGENAADVARFKGVTIREPLPKQLTSEYKDFKEVAHDERRGVRNFKVFGADGAYRYRHDVLEQAEDADSFILTRGGIMELYQFLLFVRAQREHTLDLNEKIVVIQNAHGFWNPMLRALDGVQRLGNNFVTDTRHDTAEVIEKLLGENRKSVKALRGEETEVLPPGSTVFFITGNRKKVNDYKKVFSRRGTDAQCVWFHQKFDKPEGADEFSYSYVGNLVEKLDKLYLHIRDHYGPEGFRAALAEKGYDIDQSVFWLDDSGLELEENLTSGPEFGNCTYRMNPYKQHGPGAEMKNAINAMQNQPFEGQRGTRGLIKRFEAAAERLLQQRIAAGDPNAHVSDEAIDRCSVVIVSVRDMVDAVARGESFEQVMDSVPMHFFQAATEHKLIFEPRPDANAVDTKNYLVPVKDPDQRTQAENPHYVAQHSITAQVVKAAARVLGFDKHESGSRHLTQVFAREAGEALPIGTQHSIHRGLGYGVARRTGQALKGLFRLMPGNGGRFDLAIARDHKMKNEDGSPAVMRNALNNFYDFTLRVHGFLLTPDERKISGDDFFWNRAFTFFSLIVGRQINDKAVTAKPLLVMDCPTWRPFIRLLETYSGGLIPEMPHEIIDEIVKKDDDLVKSLNRAFAEYRPDEVPSYIFREDGVKCPSDLFNVTIYCSASTTDYPMKMWARDFAFDCGALGFAVKNGGGTGPDGLMIETSEGVKLVKEPFDAFLRAQGLPGAARTHISSIQCVDTAQEEGLCKFNDYWAVYPTIYQRMHELQNADAEVVLPGGAGTMQEIAASVLMRKAGIYGIENRPLVIINHAGIFDPFLAMIPAADLKRYNISIVQTADQAMDILLEARRARKMEPALPYTQDEFKSLKKSFMRSLRQQEPGATLKSYTIS